ncbi:unnamed protein product [Acanthoscelides obtectus]|uniref:SCAN domain-containing protein 3 n=1 Tax=Acanthoscelides obtectus TaxID=200917 RepID=A0A9P0PGF7_ACAOB|nr:unnamed protein product [Acanthoscelides obtectus]CAK1637756.1 SCAN domain-containing protein 3 [Acanthoscelides obtectus]
MKPSKLQANLRRCHPDKTEKDLKYFQTLKDKFQNRPTLDRMFASTSQRNDDAKSGKPHTIGEKLILTAVEEVLKTVLHKPASDIIKRIPLSNNTVERRIDEISSDIESFLCNYLQTTQFSIQLDESTLPDNAALLLAYVRFIMNQEIYEELLFARTLITDTKAFLARVKIMKQNIGRGEFSQFPNLSQTSCQEDDVSTYVQHLNALYSDFESGFEDILTTVIPPWIINPYGDIEETNVIIQEELTELSTNEELKVQFKNGYQQFWLQNNKPVTYPIRTWKICRCQPPNILPPRRYQRQPERRPLKTSSPHINIQTSRCLRTVSATLTQYPALLRNQLHQFLVPLQRYLQYLGRFRRY